MTCPMCGHRLTGRQVSACSDRCRQRLARARRRERDARRDVELARLRALVSAGGAEAAQEEAAK